MNAAYKAILKFTYLSMRDADLLEDVDHFNHLDKLWHSFPINDRMLIMAEVA